MGLSNLQNAVSSSTPSSGAPSAQTSAMLSSSGSAPASGGSHLSAAQVNNMSKGPNFGDRLAGYLEQRYPVMGTMLSGLLPQQPQAQPVVMPQTDVTQAQLVPPPPLHSMRDTMASLLKFFA